MKLEILAANSFLIVSISFSSLFFGGKFENTGSKGQREFQILQITVIDDFYSREVEWEFVTRALSANS